MSINKNSGQGNNQSGGSSDMNIPRMAAGTPPSQPVVQPGEDAGALSAMSAGGGAGGNFGTPDTGRDEPMHMPAAESVLSQGGSLADVQKMLDQPGMNMARNRPVFAPTGQDQSQDPTRVSIEMPDLYQRDDRMLNPRGLRADQMVERVDVMNWQNKADELAFNEELVMIYIHPTSVEGDEGPVVLGVSGRQIAIPRGQPAIVRRKFVELLFRLKPESMNTRIERAGDGTPKNFIDKRKSLRHPFDIQRDDNPRGRQWAYGLRVNG